MEKLYMANKDIVEDFYLIQKEKMMSTLATDE